MHSISVLLLSTLVADCIPLRVSIATECFDFPDTTSFCVYHNSFCFDRLGVIIVDDSRDGHRINTSNVMSDNWMHLTRPEREVGLPHRSLLNGQYRSGSYLRDTGAVFLKGTTAVASFDYNKAENIYHFASSVMVAYLARIHYIDRNETLDVRHRNLVSENSVGFDRAVLLTEMSRMTDWTNRLARLVFSKGAELTYLEDISALVAAVPVCFERAVILGKSINIFSGTWDASRFRSLVASQHGIQFAKEVITVCLRRPPRQLLNPKRVVSFIESMSLGLEVVSAVFEDMSFLEQLNLISKTAVLVSVHGAGLTNSIFLPSGAAVLEISPFRFNYNLYERIAVNSGLLYVRYVASFDEMDYINSKVPDFASVAKQLTNRQCNNINPQCLEIARDVNIRIDVKRFRSYLEAALDVIE